jgi:hypothetical protein
MERFTEGLRRVLSRRKRQAEKRKPATRRDPSRIFSRLASAVACRSSRPSIWFEPIHPVVSRRSYSGRVPSKPLKQSLRRRCQAAKSAACKRTETVYLTRRQDTAARDTHGVRGYGEDETRDDVEEGRYEG